MGRVDTKIEANRVPSSSRLKEGVELAIFLLARNEAVGNLSRFLHIKSVSVD